LLLRLGQEPTSNGRVGVEGDVEFAEKREEEGVLLSRDGGVISLINSREYVVILLAVVVDLLNSVGLEIGKTEAGEDTGLVDFLNTGNPIFESNASIWGVDVKDIKYDTLASKFEASMAQSYLSSP